MMDYYQLERGFLPTTDPLTTLPREFAIWDELGVELPKLLISDTYRTVMTQLPVLATEGLIAQEELERAMLLLSFFAHAYVWGVSKPVASVPKSIAIPWYEISLKLKRPPVLSYASYALHNWRRINSNRPVELGNIVLLQNFLGGLDEEWFVLVHVDIEMKAAAALRLFFPIQDAMQEDNVVSFGHYLSNIADCLDSMCRTLERMPERCDPYIYYNRVRPYIHGWKDNPALPHGLIYEGVSAYHDKPQQFRGETGAQSTIVPSFDALFAIAHKSDPLRVYLQEMREYMPVNHREFLVALEKRGSIRDYVLQHYKHYPALRDDYNTCLEHLSRFRQTHLKYAAHYIQKQHQSSLANPTEVGTGGTPFMEYLRKHKDETLAFIIK